MYVVGLAQLQPPAVAGTPYSTALAAGANQLTQSYWSDVVTVPSGYRIEVRIQFSSIVAYGSFVAHCHIFEHEDEGMMQNVQYGQGPQQPPEMAGMK